MSFSIDVWRGQLDQKIEDWKVRFHQQGAPTLYYFLGAMTLWPAVQAAVTGNGIEVGVALATICGGIGAGLLATPIQNAKDEAEVGRQLQLIVEQKPDMREALDKVLTELQTIARAEQALPAADREWFQQTLQKELTQQGHQPTYYAKLKGNGTIVQGNNNQVATNGGMIITGGNVTFGQMMQNPVALPPGLVKLKDNLINYFSTGELQSLCFDLQLEHESFPNATRTQLAEAIVGYFHRTGRVEELRGYCQRKRPNVSWS